MKKALLLLLLLISAGVATPAFAAKVDIASSLNHQLITTYSQNTYGVGLSVKSSAEYEKDVFLIGLSTVEFSGTTEEDAIFVGGDVRISGVVEEDVRAVGGIVRISGTVEGDVVMLGGSVFIEENAVVNGDIVLVGGRVVINAPLQTRTNIIAGSVQIASEISSKDVVITGYRVVVTENAVVSGAITYFSPRQVVVDDQVIVSGTLLYNRIDPLEENGLLDQAVVSFLNFWVVLRFVTTVVLAFLLVFIFRVFTQRTVDVAQTFFLKSLLIGVASLFFIPVVIILLLLSLILFPVAILLMLATIFFWIIAGAISGIVVGNLVRALFIELRSKPVAEEDNDTATQTTQKKQSLEITFNGAVIGVVLLTVVEFVPYAGEVTRLVFLLVAFGALWLTFYKYVRWGSLFMSFKHNKKK